MWPSKDPWAHLSANSGYLRLDLSNPSAPAFDGQLFLGPANYDIATWDERVYMVGGTGPGNLKTIDPFPVQSLEDTYTGISGAANAIEIQAGVAYVAANGLFVFDLPAAAEPPHPTLLGSLIVEQCYDVAVAGEFAYLAAAERTHVIDISNPSALEYVGAYPRDGRNVVIGPQGEPWVGEWRFASISPQCASATNSPVFTGAPTAFSIRPNPTAGMASFSFTLLRDANVSLSLFDVGAVLSRRSCAVGRTQEHMSFRGRRNLTSRPAPTSLSWKRAIIGKCVSSCWRDSSLKPRIRQPSGFGLQDGLIAVRWIVHGLEKVRHDSLLAR